MCRCVFQQEGWRQGAVKLNLMNFRAELRVSTSYPGRGKDALVKEAASRPMFLKCCKPPLHKLPA